MLWLCVVHKSVFRTKHNIKPMSLWLYASTLFCFSERSICHVSPYRFSLTDGSVRKKSPGTLLFVFDHETVPMYRTYVLCTRERNRERPRARDSSSSQETPRKRLLTPRDMRLLAMRDSLLRRETPCHERLLATRDSSRRETPRDERLLATRDSSRETPRERLLARDSSRETPRERLLARDSSQRLLARDSLR